MSIEGHRGPARPMPCRFSKGQISFSFGISPTSLSPPNTPSTYNPSKTGCYAFSLPRQDLITGKSKITSPGLDTLLQASTKPWQKLVWACPVEVCGRAITWNSFGEQIPWNVPELWPFVDGWASSSTVQHLDILGSLASEPPVWKTGDTLVPISISCSSQWDSTLWKHEISLYFKGSGIINFKQRAK